jgi:cellulose synthase/poly-beta-1,6-N-acetylglucosamine synthase-like glycosyltransferase
MVDLLIYYTEGILLFVYLIGIMYLILFRFGYGKKVVEHTSMYKVLEIDVIIPIYREDPDMIKKCLNSLQIQKNLKINAIIIIKDPNEKQKNLINTYDKKFNSIKVVVQNGKPSQNIAYLLGMQHVSTNYVCILSSDSKILKNNCISRLLSLAYSEKADVSFGLALPEITTSHASRFTAIEKVFRQYLLVKGRGALGMGYYFPGNFAVIKSSTLRRSIKRLIKNNTMTMYDLGTMLQLYASKKGRLSFIGVPVVTEAERGSFKGWALQSSRWFIGTFGLYSYYKNFFTSAENKLKVGWFGVIWSWRILPVALVIGLALVPLSLNGTYAFLIFYIATYMILTLILFSISEERGYGTTHLLLHWLVTSLVKSFAILIAIYEYVFIRFKREELYKLFVR